MSRAPERDSWGTPMGKMIQNRKLGEKGQNLPIAQFCEDQFYSSNSFCSVILRVNVGVTIIGQLNQSLSFPLGVNKISIPDAGHPRLVNLKHRLAQPHHSTNSFPVFLVFVFFP